MVRLLSLLLTLAVVSPCLAQYYYRPMTDYQRQRRAELRERQELRKAASRDYVAQRQAARIEAHNTWARQYNAQVQRDNEFFSSAFKAHVARQMFPEPPERVYFYDMTRYRPGYYREGDRLVFREFEPLDAREE